VLLLIALPVLYVASFGPACWITSRLDDPHTVFDTVYKPLCDSGYAIGGLAVGESYEVTCEIASIAASRLPFERPRYLMGVGKPEQIADYVSLGVDMMDCVLPTRSARHGCLFTSEGPLLIRGARYANDSLPIDEKCECEVCRRYSRAYLRHLYSTGEFLSIILNTYHNLHFYLDMMRRIREAIRFGKLERLRSDLQARLSKANPSGRRVW